MSTAVRLQRAQPETWTPTSKSAWNADLPFLREWAHCLSLAGLCCLRLWIEPWLTESKQPARDDSYALLTCCILSLVFLIGRRFAVARPWIFAVTVVLFAKELFLTAGFFGWHNSTRLPMVIVVVAAAVYLRGFLHRTATVFTACAIALTLWGAISSPPIAASASSKARTAPVVSSQRRIIWIVADELDERLAFSQRPPQLVLPALDRFREHAEYPGTLKKPISLLPGQLDSLRKITRHAVVAWPHPEDCRTPSCSAWTPARQANSYDPHPLANRFRSFLETERFSPFGLPLSAEHHIEQMREIERNAISAASDPALSFVFLHLPHARPPYVWDAAHHEPASAIADSEAGRLHSLAWLDSVFANIRSSMETSGVWDRSVVLVTANLDGNSGNAPFLLKSPDWVDLDPAEPIDPGRTTLMMEELLLRPAPLSVTDPPR